MKRIHLYVCLLFQCLHFIHCGLQEPNSGETQPCACTCCHITIKVHSVASFFLSAQPEEEHHEVALCPGRDVPAGAKVIQQVSFIVEDLPTLKQFYQRLKQEGVRFRSIVSHGIALAIYCYDPDDNVVEIYAKTPYKIAQPLSEPVDLELSDEELLAIAEGGKQA